MEWIAQYWLEFAFGLVIAALGLAYKGLSKKLKEEIRDQKALRDGVQSLLRDRIIQCHNHYIDKGYIPVYGMENVLSMYDAYHELGGNGTVTKLVDTLKELPTDKPDREKGATI